MKINSEDVVIGGVSVPLCDVKSGLVDSVTLREDVPLAVNQLVRILLEDDCTSRDLSREVLDYLPLCCRPNELHTMLLDAWTWLWQGDMTCRHPCVPLSSCLLSDARADVAHALIDVLLRTKKGALFKYQGNHMLTFAGQFLSKYWLPESRGRMHIISDPEDRWLLCHNRMVEYFLATDEVSDNTRQTVNVEIGLRLVAAAVETVSKQGLMSASVSSRIYSVFRNSPHKYLEARFNTMDIINPGIAPSICDRPSDLELFDSDIALLVSYSELGNIRNPSFLPLVWSAKSRLEISIKSASILLRSEDHIALGMRTSLQLLGVRKESTWSSQHVPLVSAFVQHVLERATEWGSEDDFSLADRQKVFTLISGVIGTVDRETGMAICAHIVENSKSDSCIGLSVKMAKDIVGDSQVEFFKFARSVFQDPSYQVIDGMDTLKSILNWARLVVGKGDSEECNMAWFKKQMEALGKQVDSALAAEPNSIQSTRLVMIGHLVGLVMDLVRKGHCRECNHS